MPVYKKNSFRVDGLAMRYSSFVPRLFNFCLSLGMKPNRIMPSRAFCSDENQGYPIILIAKHFGTFPFNHGRVGGIVVTDRHQPHAQHGRDSVVIQASHVGFEPDTIVAMPEILSSRHPAPATPWNRRGCTSGS